MGVQRFFNVLRRDLQLWDGRELTGSKRDRGRARVTGLKIGNTVDVLQVYGEGVSYTGRTIQDAITAIGSTNKVTLELAPGTWTIDENLTVGSNFNLKPVSGAVLKVSTGVTLTLNCSIEAGLFEFIDNSGTVAGTPLVDRFFPEWFGAKRDGSTDDSPAIQECINLASTANGEVFFSSGTYVVGSTIVPKSNVHVTGAGHPAVVKLKDAGNVDIFSTAASINNLGFSNFTIDGNKANNSTNGSCIVLSSTGVSSDNIFIRGMKVFNANGEGIEVGSTTASTLITNLIIQNNLIQNAASRGILIRDYVKGTQIDHNKIVSSTGISIYIRAANSSFITVTNNYIESSTTDSIYVDDATDTVISGNMINSCGNDAIFIGGNRSVVTGNVITAASGEAISVFSCNDVTVLSNLLINCSGDGIFVATVNNMTCTGNTIRMTAVNKQGIDIAALTDSCIADNTIIGATGTSYGICLSSTSNGVIMNHNRVSGFDGSGGAGINIVDTSGITFVTITGNDLRGNDTPLLMGSNSTDILVRDNRLGTTFNSFVLQGVIETN